MSESVIADDLHIKGEVTTSGDIELKGTVVGDVTCRTLLIAEDAKIEGTAKAEKVVVRGTVEGQINGIRVTLTSSAKVKGELICKALSVDEEAYFDGTSQRVEDPLGIESSIAKGSSAATASGTSAAPGSVSPSSTASESKSGKDGDDKSQSAGASSS